jgi:hypothetical protein
LLRNIWRTRRIMAVTISKPGKVEITSDSWLHYLFKSVFTMCSGTIICQ